MSARVFDLEDGTARQFPRELGDHGTNYVPGNFQRGTQSGVGNQEMRSIGAGELAQSCYNFIAQGLLYLKNILDLHRPIGFWIFLISGVIVISVDPLLFYASVINSEKKCLGLDTKLQHTAFILHLVFSLYVIFGSLKYFSSHLLDVVFFYPMTLLRLLANATVGSGKVSIFLLLSNLFLFEYLLVVIRISILFKKATKTSVIFAQAKWAKAVFNLLLYMHGGHVFGALWYFFAVEREIVCWKEACLSHKGCNPRSFFCDDGSHKFLNALSCPARAQNETVYDFGIFHDAIQSRIVEVTNFPVKLLYCLRWGLQSLSCFGQNLQPSTFAGENIFVISITIYALVLFVSLVGNKQTYLQSETTRSEEMRLQGEETEQWMTFWKLSAKLRKEVKKYQPYKWRETRSFDVRNLFNNLPRDLRKNIKFEICLELLKKVEEFGKLSESWLEDLCDCLKPVNHIERTLIVREGDPIYEMLFVVQGKLRIYTSKKTETEDDYCHRKNDHLKDGDFCGNEIVTLFQADPYSSNLPISTRTIQALTNVEAFVLLADDLQKIFVKQYVAVHFIQSFWRFRRVLRSRDNAPTSNQEVYTTESQMEVVPDNSA